MVLKEGDLCPPSLVKVEHMSVGLCGAQRAVNGHFTG